MRIDGKKKDRQVFFPKNFSSMLGLPHILYYRARFYADYLAKRYILIRPFSKFRKVRKFFERSEFRKIKLWAILFFIFILYAKDESQLTL